LSYLVDTNVVSELRKGPRARPAVSSWFARVDSSELFLSVLVVGELRQGTERIRRRDPTAAAHLDRWMGRLVQSYAERILPIDGRVAELWGRLNVPDPLPAVDGLLAATAIVNDLTLVTRDTRQIVRTGARLHDPFTE
jgi:predicted nucleic acid-binding protein